MVKPFYYDNRLQVEHTLSTSSENTRMETKTLSKKTGLRKCARNCRTRGNNQRVDFVHNNFSPEEEELVIKLHATIGSRWSIIAQQLPERSDDDVKNLWNTKLKKKLSAMGIDPITHRPYSKILVDYGNISGNRIIQYNHNRITQSYGPSSKMKLLSNGHPAPLYDQDHSVELLSQLHAIKMVTEASTSTQYNNNSSTVISAKMPNKCFSSSVSSTSPESPHRAEWATDVKASLTSPNFCWRDFLSTDTFLPAYHAQENNEKQVIAEEEEQQQRNNCTESFSSLSSFSFVEDMIERENEIFSETHSIFLEEPFYY